MKIAVLPSAMDDLAAGFAFYEKQEAGLGSYFLDSVFADVDSLKLYAGIHRRVFGFYRLLAKRFPYAIYYAMDAEQVFIRAILDCRRDPNWIRRKLK